MGTYSETEMQNIYQTGVAQQIMKEQGADALVYKEVFSGACQHCIKFYTTAGIGSKPRIFKLIDLINNGDNIGRKVKDWKPVLNSVHPFCRCDLREVPKGMIWNDETHSFEPPKEPYKRQVERKSKVKIYVGDKMFEV